MWRIGCKDEIRESILAEMKKVVEEMSCPYCGGDCRLEEIDLKQETIYKKPPEGARDLHIPEFEGWILYGYRIVCLKCGGVLEHIENSQKLVFPDHGSFLYRFLSPV